MDFTVDEAYCTKNKETYSAEKFSELPENLLALYRKHLQCPDCKQKAYFQKAHSRMAALFGASPHTPECSERRTDPNKTKSIHKDLVSHLSEGVRAIELNLGNCNIADDIEGDKPREVDQGASNKLDRPLSAGTSHVSNNWNLEEVLDALVKNPALAQSKHVVSAKGVIEAQPFSNFLVNTTSLDRRVQGLTKGFWGRIVNANHAQNGAIWLNSGSNWGGGGGTLDICIPSDLEAAFKTLYQTKNPIDLRGSYVLVIGNVEGPSVDFKLHVQHLGQIAVLMVPDGR